MELNKEQVGSAIRWLVTAFGAGLAGYFAAWGFGSQEQWMQLLTNPNVQAMVATGVVTLVPLVKGWLSHSEKNTVAAANSMPNVDKVITTDSAAGQALAKAIPAPTVVSAADVVIAEKEPPTVKDK